MSLLFEAIASVPDLYIFLESCASASEKERRDGSTQAEILRAHASLTGHTPSGDNMQDADVAIDSEEDEVYEQNLVMTQPSFGKWRSKTNPASLALHARVLGHGAAASPKRVSAPIAVDGPQDCFPEGAAFLSPRHKAQVTNVPPRAPASADIKEERGSATAFFSQSAEGQSGHLRSIDQAARAPISALAQSTPRGSSLARNAPSASFIHPPPPPPPPPSRPRPQPRPTLTPAPQPPRGSAAAPGHASEVEDFEPPSFSLGLDLPPPLPSMGGQVARSPWLRRVPLQEDAGEGGSLGWGAELRGVKLEEAERGDGGGVEGIIGVGRTSSVKDVETPVPISNVGGASAAGQIVSRLSGSGGGVSGVGNEVRTHRARYIPLFEEEEEEEEENEVAPPIHGRGRRRKHGGDGESESDSDAELCGIQINGPSSGSEKRIRVTPPTPPPMGRKDKGLQSTAGADFRPTLSPVSVSERCGEAGGGDGDGSKESSACGWAEGQGKMGGGGEGVEGVKGVGSDGAVGEDYLEVNLSSQETNPPIVRRPLKRLRQGGGEEEEGRGSGGKLRKRSLREGGGTEEGLRQDLEDDIEDFCGGEGPSVRLKQSPLDPFLRNHCRDPSRAPPRHGGQTGSRSRVQGEGGRGRQGYVDIDLATGDEEEEEEEEEEEKEEEEGEGERGKWGAREVPGGSSRGMGPQGAGWGPQAMGGDFCRESEEVEALLRERMPHYRSIPQLAVEGGAGGEAVYIDYRHQFGEGESAGAAAGRGGNDRWHMPSQTGPGRGARGASCRDGRSGGSAEGGPSGHWVNEGGRKLYVTKTGRKVFGRYAYLESLKDKGLAGAGKKKTRGKQKRGKRR